MRKSLSDTKTLALISLMFFIQCAGLLFSMFHLPVTGDESILMIMAQDIAAGAMPLLFYSQPYQFPLESYLFAITTLFTEPSVSAARVPGWLLRQLGLLLLALTAVRLFSGYTRYCVLLLLAIPPVSMFILTALYGIPQYSFMFFAFALLTFILSYFATQSANTRFNVARNTLCIFAFFFSALSLSSYKLSIVFVAPFLVCLSLMLLGKRQWRTILLGSICFVIGLIPMLLARLYYPTDALDSLTQTIAFSQALEKLVSVTLPVVIPKLMGANAASFAIWTHDLIHYPAVIGYLCLLLFIGLLALALLRLLKSAYTANFDQHVIMTAYVIGCLFLGIVAFSFVERAKDFTARYLIIAVWVLPFLLAYAIQSRRKAQLIMCTITAGFLLFNSVNIARAIFKWQQPDFLTRVADTPPLENEIALLLDKGIEYCFASYLYAHRITYLSNRKIHCIQPYNERFPDWPLPYREAFITEPNVAYLKSQTHGTLYTDYGFAVHLKKNQMRYARERIGMFTRFHSFEYYGDNALQNNIPVIMIAQLPTSLDVHTSQKAVRLVAASKQQLPTSIGITCNNVEQQITPNFLNFYFDGHKPLMFVNNQVIALNNGCANARISLQ